MYYQYSRKFMLPLLLLTMITSGIYARPARMELVFNQGHFSETRKIAISADGSVAITQPEYREDVMMDPLKLWDLRSGKLIRNLPGYDFALSPDKKIVYINRALTNKQAENCAAPVEVWNLATIQPIAGSTWKYRIASISRDGQRALSHDFLESDFPARDAFIFDLHTGHRLFDIAGELLAISDDLLTALVRRNGAIGLYNISNDRLLQALPSELGDRYWLSNKGEFALLISGAGAARIWHRADNQITAINGSYRECQVLSYDSAVALLSTSSGQLVILDLDKARILSTIKNSRDQRPLACAFNRDNTRLMLLWPTLELTIYQVNSGEIARREILKDLDRGDIENGAIELDPDRLIIVGGGLETFHCWDLNDNLNTHRFSRLARVDIPANCHINHSGDLLVCRHFYDEETCRWSIWDLKKGQPIALPELTSGSEEFFELISIANHWGLFHNGSEFALINLANGQKPLSFSARRATFSADGKRLLMIDIDGGLKLLDLDKLAWQAIMPKSATALRDCALNNDGGIAATLDEQSRVTIWDVNSDQIIVDLPEIANAPISGLALSASGRTIITSHCDGNIRVWSSAGELLQLLRAHQRAARIYISADENRALSISLLDNNWRLWDLKESNLIATRENAIDHDAALDVSLTDDLSRASINGAIWDLDRARKLSSTQSGYATIFPNGRLAITAGASGFELNDIAERQLLATLIDYEDQWLIITPDSHFDGSPATWPLLCWRNADDARALLPIEYFSDCYQPGLLVRLLHK
jgi:WD40 repeat protein